MDIILVARDTWGTLWRRRQFLADEFSRSHRVLFVERPHSFTRSLILGQDSPRRRHALRAHPRQVQDNLFVMTPPKPVPDNPPMLARANRAVLSMLLQYAARDLGMRRPVLWLNPEYAVWMPDALSHALVIYDVTDDWTRAASLPPRELRQIQRNDRLMLQRADLVFTVSEDLYDKKSPHNPNTVLMPNGVQPALYDIEHAARPPELQAVHGPVAGYTGTLHTDRLDIGLIEHLSLNGDFTQVFVGPNHLDEQANARLAALPNVLLVPEQPYHKLPAFVFHFDACSIPHAVTDFTHSLDPIKAYEYLAAGKPMVSVDVRGIRPLADFVHIASGPDDYLEKLNTALKGQSKSHPATMKAEARKHSWSARAGQIMEHIQTAIENKQRR